jgi:uncharacterized cupredoxin-like copper-binding protein
MSQTDTEHAPRSCSRPHARLGSPRAARHLPTDSREASLRSQFKALAVLGMLLLSLPAVAGCGSSNKNNNSTTSTTSTAPTTTKPSGGGGTASTLKLTADPSGALKFDKVRLFAKPGKVTIKMNNPSPVQHGIAILGNGVAVTGNTVGTGGTAILSTTLPAGRYDFYCPVDGHKQAGMSGRLIVK